MSVNDWAYNTKVDMKKPAEQWTDVEVLAALNYGQHEHGGMMWQTLPKQAFMVVTKCNVDYLCTHYDHERRIDQRPVKKRAVTLHFKKGLTGCSYNFYEADGTGQEYERTFKTKEVAELIVRGELEAQIGRYKEETYRDIEGSEWGEGESAGDKIAQQLKGFLGSNISEEDAERLAKDPNFVG